MGCAPQGGALQRTGLFRRLTHARTVSNHCLTGDPKSRALEETRRYKGDTKVVLAQIQKASNQACCPSMMWDLGVAVDPGLEERLACLPIIAALYRGESWSDQHRDRVRCQSISAPSPFPGETVELSLRLALQSPRGSTLLDKVVAGSRAPRRRSGPLDPQRHELIIVAASMLFAILFLEITPSSSWKRLYGSQAPYTYH